MSTTQSDRLRELLEPLVAAQGLDLEDIELSRAGKRRMLRIIVDSDEGVELDACAELSRVIGEKLDETDAMGDGEYVLEVSSPGADRPLTQHRHYVRATGRLVKFQLSTEGGKAAGELIARILGVDDEGLDLEVPGVKGRKATARRLAFTDVAKARVEIEFNRKDKKEEEA
ncbi:ribosome maturation factor RimP [Streptomyces bambusae]|uniref:Ribosome maturation factor RimP n=1 Tax=Streptomyces bambusae TaxID=1550616 RepID=A0ABS6ZH02_9ACTN|nr:ribosome maturation factor RimP [Streptomyces bambusae]MBW5486871.1 ribosome maturation factor RimP [Streptomyces bambusae]